MQEGKVNVIGIWFTLLLSRPELLESETEDPADPQVRRLLAPGWDRYRKILPGKEMSEFQEQNSDFQRGSVHIPTPIHYSEPIVCKDNYFQSILRSPNPGKARERGMKGGIKGG